MAPHKPIQTAIRNSINRKKPFPDSWDSPLGSETCLQIISADFFLLWFADLLVCHSSVGVNWAAENREMQYKKISQWVTEGRIFYQSKHRCLQTTVKLTCRPKTTRTQGEGVGISDSLMDSASSLCLKDLVWMGRARRDRTASSCYMVLGGR